MVVDTAVNSLQPAVRDLLEQAPATIRDEYDPNPTDWSTMGQFDTFWSGYPTVTPEMEIKFNWIPLIRL
jgi:hypothetical protein